MFYGDNLPALRAFDSRQIVLLVNRLEAVGGESGDNAADVFSGNMVGFDLDFIKSAFHGYGFYVFGIRAGNHNFKFFSFHW